MHVLHRPFFMLKRKCPVVPLKVQKILQVTCFIHFFKVRKSSFFHDFVFNLAHQIFENALK
jgi:hypothetical protein